MMKKRKCIFLGPIELKESLTNGNNPFEKECIDLFHIEDDDIGDPISLTITLEPKGNFDNNKKTKNNFIHLLRFITTCIQ